MKKLLLATAIALGFASGAQAATPWPLGAFLEGIEQGGSGFANQMATWVPLMGQRPVIGDMYIYYADPPSSWYSDANTELDSAKNNSCWMGTGTGACSGSPMEPMVGIPMGSSASGYDSTTSEIDSVLHEYFSGGALESTVRHVVDEAKTDGFTHIAVRPGIEINLSSTAGGPQGNTTLEADYITAFRQIYTDLKSEGAAQGVTVDVVWNPGAAADNADGDIFNTLWPGASYVDIIAADFYDDPFPFGYPNYWDFYNSGNTSVGSQNFPGSGAYDGSSLQAMYNATPGSWENGTGNSTPPNAHDTINQEEYYSYPSSGNGGQDETGTPSLADSVLQLMAFAKAQGKPFGLAETGAGNGATHGDGLVDNSVFPAWLAGVLKAYTGTVAWVVIWTNTDSGEIYNFLDGTKPHEAAAWAANFGTTATGGGGGTGGGGTTSPANTQVNGTEGEIYDTSGNEWTLVGGVLDRNGVATPSTGLTSEFWTGSVLYILSAGSGWYTVNLANGDGTTASVPAGYIAPHAASAANTDITGTSGTLYDTSGLPWTINGSQQIVRGDAIVPSSAQVVTLYWTGSAFDQMNSSGSWYTQPLDGSAGVATTAPAGYSAPLVNITVSPTTETVATSDTTSVKPFTGMAITDGNAGQTETATVSQNANANGALSDPNAATDGSTIASNVLTVSGTAAAVDTALDGIVFTPTQNQVAAGSSVTTTITAAIQDTAGKTASSVTTVTATQVHATSAANTQVNGTSGVIYDTSGVAWAINASQQITMNGTVVASSADVVTLFWTGTALDQLNTSGAWYTQPLNGTAGTELAGAPTGYTAPGTHAASAAGTEVTASGGTIYDTNGVAWTLSGGLIQDGGTALTAPTSVSLLYWTGTALYALTTGGTWYAQPLTGAAATTSSAPAGYSPTPTAISITPATRAVSLNVYATGQPNSVNPFANIAITDANSSQTETVTVTPSNTANGVLTDPNATNDGSTTSGGVITIHGSAASVALDLDNIVFTPTQNQVSVGASVTTVITISDTDTIGQTATATSTVTATQLNPQPFAGNKGCWLMRPSLQRAA